MSTNLIESARCDCQTSEHLDEGRVRRGMPENAWFIRPSGNPANKEILTKMAGEDVTEMKSELLEIKVLDVMSDCASPLSSPKRALITKGRRTKTYTRSRCFTRKKEMDGNWRGRTDQPGEDSIRICRGRGRESLSLTRERI